MTAVALQVCKINMLDTVLLETSAPQLWVTGMGGEVSQSKTTKSLALDKIALQFSRVAHSYPTNTLNNFCVIHFVNGTMKVLFAA